MALSLVLVGPGQQSSIPFSKATSAFTFPIMGIHEMRIKDSNSFVELKTNGTVAVPKSQASEWEQKFPLLAVGMLLFQAKSQVLVHEAPVLCSAKSF